MQDAPPAAPQHERFVHDPWRPAPSVGLHHGGGFADRATADARFTTAPLDAPLPPWFPAFPPPPLRLSWRQVGRGES